MVSGKSPRQGVVDAVRRLVTASLRLTTTHPSSTLRRVTTFSQLFCFSSASAFASAYACSSEKLLHESIVSGRGRRIAQSHHEGASRHARVHMSMKLATRFSSVLRRATSQRHYARPFRCLAAVPQGRDSTRTDGRTDKIRGEAPAVKGSAKPWAPPLEKPTQFLAAETTELRSDRRLEHRPSVPLS